MLCRPSALLLVIVGYIAVVGECKPQATHADVQERRDGFSHIIDYVISGMLTGHTHNAPAEPSHHSDHEHDDHYIHHHHIQPPPQPMCDRHGRSRTTGRHLHTGSHTHWNLVEETKAFEAQIAQPMKSENLPVCAVIGATVGNFDDGPYLQVMYNKMNTSYFFWDELSMVTMQIADDAPDRWYTTRRANMGDQYPELWHQYPEDSTYPDAVWRYQSQTVFFVGHEVHVYNYSVTDDADYWDSVVMEFRGLHLQDEFYPRTLAEELKQVDVANVPPYVTAALWLLPNLYLFIGDIVYAYQVGGIFPNVQYAFINKFDITENGEGNPFSVDTGTAWRPGRANGPMRPPGQLTAMVTDPQNEFFIAFSGRALYRYTISTKRWDSLGIVVTPCNPLPVKNDGKLCSDSTLLEMYFTGRYRSTSYGYGCIYADLLEHDVQVTDDGTIFNGENSYLELFALINWFQYTPIRNELNFYIELDTIDGYTMTELVNATESKNRLMGVFSNGDCNTKASIWIAIENLIVTAHIATVDADGNQQSATFAWDDKDAEHSVVKGNYAGKLIIELRWVRKEGYAGLHVGGRSDLVSRTRVLTGDYVVETGVSSKLGVVCVDCTQHYFGGQYGYFRMSNSPSDYDWYD